MKKDNSAKVTLFEVLLLILALFVASFWPSRTDMIPLETSFILSQYNGDLKAALTAWYWIGWNGVKGAN